MEFSFNSNISFSKVFGYSSDLAFQPSSTFATSLEDVSGYFTNTENYYLTVALVTNASTVDFSAWRWIPYPGIIYFEPVNVTALFTGTHITPRTGTLSRTLTSVTGVFTARFYYFRGTLAVTTAQSTAIITGRFALTTGTFSSTLADLTSTITIRFYYFRGTWTSSLINVGIILRGGSLINGVLSKTLTNTTTSIVLRVPIAINVTLAVTTAYLTCSVYGRAYPTGRLTQTLTNCTVAIRGTLPIAISVTFNANTQQLFRNFVGRAWPAGNLSRTLVSCTTVITGRVPIRITVTLGLGVDIIRTNIRVRTPVAAYIAASTSSIYILWYLNFQMPRSGTLASTLAFSTIFYAKISSSGNVGVTLAPTTSNINLRTPIRIYVTMGLVTSKFSTFLIRAKCAIGGPLAITTANIRVAIYLKVPIWMILNTVMSDTHLAIAGRVPIAITATINTTLLSAKSYLTGRGHHIPTFNPTLAALISNFRIQASVKGVLTLTNFNGPFITVNKFFSARIGSQWPYRSGKYWKLQIFGNNGDQDNTTFEKIKLLKPQADGTLVDILDSVIQSEQFSADNAEYSSPDGMQIVYTLNEDTEIRAYEMEGA